MSTYRGNQEDIGNYYSPDLRRNRKNLKKLETSEASRINLASRRANEIFTNGMLELGSSINRGGGSRRTLWSDSEAKAETARTTRKAAEREGRDLAPESMAPPGSESRARWEGERRGARSKLYVEKRPGEPFSFGLPLVQSKCEWMKTVLWLGHQD